MGVVVSDFGRILKSLLNNRGITQADIAGKVGISTSRLNNYITGRNFPSIEILIAIADCLEVTVDYLLGRNHEYLKHYKKEDASDMINFYVNADNKNGDTHKTTVPLYKTVSDPLKFFYEKTFESTPTFSMCPRGFNEEERDYALTIGDTSMSPYLMPEDVIYIERCEIKYPATEKIDFNEVFAVRLSEKDSIGLTLRKVIFRSNICILVPINPEYPATTIYLEENGFNPIVGKPVAVIRNLRDYNNKLLDILTRN